MGVPDWTSQEFLVDPYPHYARLREQTPVYFDPDRERWILTRYADVQAVLRDDARFSAEQSETPNSMLVSDPPQHTRLRSLVSKAFTPRAVRELIPRIHQIVDDLLDAIKDDDEIEAIEQFAYPLPITVIADMFDIPAEHRDRFQRLSHDIARGMDHFYSRSSSSSTYGELSAYFRDLVEERRARPGGDLMSQFLEPTETGDRLTTDEAIGLSTSLLFAGHETTVNLIGNGVLALLRNPGELERVRDDERVGVTAVEELLRYDSPAQLIGRAALDSLELDGAKIAKGDAVALLLGSANHDEARFRDPGRLDVARKPNAHLAFGLGHHFCAGANLSRLEGRAAIPALLRRFPRIRPGTAPPKWRETAVLRGLESFPVQVN